MVKEIEFHLLIEKAISIAERLIEKKRGTDELWMVEMANLAIEKFRRIENEAKNGLLPSSVGLNLGITRELGEWAPSELYGAGRDVEEFYVEHWK